MASYWIVVPRGNVELFELLSMAFKGRSGFNVIVDRRSADDVAAGSDRRARTDVLGPDEIVVAERAERAERATTSEGQPVRRRATSRRPIVRRAPKPAERGPGSPRLAEPISARGRQRLFSL